MAGFPCDIMPWWSASSGRNSIDLCLQYTVSETKEMLKLFGLLLKRNYRSKRNKGRDEQS